MNIFHKIIKNRLLRASNPQEKRGGGRILPLLENFLLTAGFIGLSLYFKKGVHVYNNSIATFSNFLLIIR